MNNCTCWSSSMHFKKTGKKELKILLCSSISSLLVESFRIANELIHLYYSSYILRLCPFTGTLLTIMMVDQLIRRTANSHFLTFGQRWIHLKIYGTV